MPEAIRDALWQQYAGAIAMLDNAVVACPDELWAAPLWKVSGDSGSTADTSEFWSLAAHAARWLERYFEAAPEEEFASLRSAAALTPEPGARLSKEQVRGALATLRQRCHDVLGVLNETELQRPVSYEWIAKEPFPYIELLIYNLRHLQEHAAQLSLFLGQHGVPDEALDWVGRADG